MSLPRLYVSPPKWSQSPYGLLSVAEPQPSADAHWMNGITYEPLCGSIGTLANPCLSPPVSGGFTKTATSNRTIRGANPFTVYQFIDCGVVGNYDRVEQDTVELLRRYEQQAVERVFWTGTAQGITGIIYPHLAANVAVIDGTELLQPAATSVTGVSLDVVEGLGRLEAALAACYTGQGVIHMTPTIAEIAMSQYLLYRTTGPNGGQALQTVNGNWVAVGCGYPGTSPAGATTVGAEWMYATGSVFYYRSDIKPISRPSEAVVRSINDMVYIAERTYVLGWDCCLFGVPISTGGVVSGATNSPS